jgi:hypothetical protein
MHVLLRRHLFFSSKYNGDAYEVLTTRVAIFGVGVGVGVEVELWQGDQIRQIFDHWVIVYSGHIFENSEVAPILGQMFPGRGFQFVQ